jgi:peptidoglycan/LPS O-acetylase OafA/YrhL
MDPRSDRFPLMDSLRGIAALMVLAVHTSALAGALGPDAAVQPYVPRLEAAFTIFFVVSGFLIYRPFVRARLRGEPPPMRLRAYGWRRFLRVVPAYWVALTAVTIWLGLGGVFSFDGVFIYYGFAQVYRDAWTEGGLPQGWTLSVEVAYYSLLPLYVLVMQRVRSTDPARRMRSELVGAFALIGFSFAWVSYHVLLGDTDVLSYSPVPVLSALPGYLDHIAMGMALAVVSCWLAERERLPALVRLIERWPSLSWGVAAVAFVVAAQVMPSTPRELYTESEYLLRHVFNSIIAIGMVLPAIFGDPQRGVVRRIMANRVLLYLGLISYGFYLFHYAVILQLVRWDWGDHAFVHPYLHWFFPALAGSVILGSLSYYLVERPALSLKRLVAARRAPAEQGALAEPAPATPPTV